jgi:sigma-B regulation protein RsbU (phosphoserine phosphatase)
MSYNFATLFYGMFDMENKKLFYCNAGMPSPVIIRGNGEIKLMESCGPFIGIFGNPLFLEMTVDIAKDDRIIFFTDGAFDARNSSSNL